VLAAGVQSPAPGIGMLLATVEAKDLEILAAGDVWLD
jgi:hypothetical protein